MSSIHKLLRFEVRTDKLDEALALIRSFVDEVGRKEGGTASYVSLQEKDAPTRFTHYMVFRVTAAEGYHQKTAWNKRFFAALEPLCTQPPTATSLEQVAGT